MPPTKDQLTAALMATMAVAEAIREIGTVPSGTLYAQLCGKISIEVYEKIIGTLKNTGLVAESQSHLLTWTGPKLEDKR